MDEGCHDEWAIEDGRVSLSLLWSDSERRESPDHISVSSRRRQYKTEEVIHILQSTTIKTVRDCGDLDESAG